MTAKGENAEPTKKLTAASKQPQDGASESSPSESASSESFFDRVMRRFLQIAPAAIDQGGPARLKVEAHAP